MDDLLFVIAEIGMALAGFASIATALAHSQEDQVSATHRLRVMLVLSLGVVFLSLLPAILNQFGVGLRVAASIFAGVLVLYNLPFSPTSRSLRATQKAGVSWHPFYKAFIVGLIYVPLLGCAGVALGVMPELAGGIYVGSLTSVLLVAAISFARMVLSLIQPVTQ